MGYLGAADLTPRARVEGAGAAQIYSPPPRDIPLSHTRRQRALLRHSHTVEFPQHSYSSRRLSEKQAYYCLWLYFMSNMTMHESYHH